jgi:hypothetical protein
LLVLNGRGMHVRNYLFQKVVLGPENWSDYVPSPVSRSLIRYDLDWYLTESKLSYRLRRFKTPESRLNRKRDPRYPKGLAVLRKSE